MDRAEAARLLGLGRDADPNEIRRAFRALIRRHHPDLDQADDGTTARELIAAYHLLLAPTPEGQPLAVDDRRSTPPPDPSIVQPTVQANAPWADMLAGSWPSSVDDAVPVVRLDGDTLALGAPADEVFRILIEAAHDVGDVTYLDRSVPILEVLCRFVGEPATSLVLTLQGRATFTEVFCTVESIEARPAPPTDAVVDLLQDALVARQLSP